MMERKLFNTPVAVLAAVLGIVQSLIWIVCCILAICVHENAIEYEVPTDNLQLDLFIEMFLKNNEAPFSFSVATPKTVNIFMYFYMIFSFVWLIQSCWVLKDLSVDVIHDKMYSHTWKIFISWAVMTFILSLMDLVLMSLVSYDTSQYVLDFSEFFMSYEIYNAMWFMLLWSARGFILLIANMILASFMLHFAINIRKDIERCLLGGTIIRAYDHKTNNISNLPWTTQATLNPLALSYDTSFENSLPRSDSFLAIEKDNPAPTQNNAEQQSFINSYRKRISNNRISGNPSSLHRSNTMTDSPDGPPSLMTHSTSLPSFSKQNSMDSLYQIPGQRERSSPERRSPSPNYGKLAKIGNHGRNSPLTNVSPPKVPSMVPPVIPPPDYSPSSSPRSVLKAKSNYY